MTSTCWGWPAYSRWTWWPALLLALILLLMILTGKGPGAGCCYQETVAVAPVPAAVPAPLAPPATAPADTQADAAACAERLAAGLVFATGTVALDERGKAVLAEAVPCLKKGAYVIAGYADNSGSKALNDRLSLQRAESVRLFLIEQGLAADSLTAKGYGPENPVADNTTREGRARNRRVELVPALN